MNHNDLAQSFIQELERKDYYLRKSPVKERGLTGFSYYFGKDRVLRLLDEPTFPNEIIIPKAIQRFCGDLKRYREEVKKPSTEDRYAWWNTHPWSIRLTKDNFEEILGSYLGALEQL